MINIQMYNVKSRINNFQILPCSVQNDICFTCSFVKTGFGISNTRSYLINPKSGIVYSGLLPYIIAILKKNNIAYHIDDCRVKPDKKFNWRIVNGFMLRDYQKRIVDQLQSTSRMTIFAATSAGKTFILANICIQTGCTTLVIAPKISLSIQLRNEFHTFLGIKIGLINGATSDYLDDNKQPLPIIVATPQSLRRYPELVANTEAILFDEVHNLPAKCIRDIAFAAKNAYYRIGCSGSPWRDDGQTLVIDAALAPRNPHDRISASELINQHVLTPIDITFINCDSHCAWEGSYIATYMKGVVYNDTRNQYIVRLAQQHVNANHPTIILVSKTKHGELLMNLLHKKIQNKTYIINHESKNYVVHTIEFLSGQHDINFREAVFKSIRQGTTKLCVATTILDEGVSISNLQCLIMAQGGCSTTRLFQRIGRVIRKYADKNKAYVYDFMDSNPTLYAHSQIRLQLMQMEPAWHISFMKENL